jgi:transcriptional regulator with XRE-family HTH domain
MGRNSRTRPARLAEKLRIIREKLNLSQDGMLSKLELAETDGFERSVISAYELDKREPALDVLLLYARVANVYLEVIVDDKLDLPNQIPANRKSEGIQTVKIIP